MARAGHVALNARAHHAADGGNANGGANTNGCDIDLGIGDAIGGACDGLGDALGAGADACGALGNIGSCAVPLAAPGTSPGVRGQPPGLGDELDDGAAVDGRGAMPY